METVLGIVQQKMREVFLEKRWVWIPEIGFNSNAPCRLTVTPPAEGVEGLDSGLQCLY
jgi:hypothetical protein